MSKPGTRLSLVVMAAALVHCSGGGSSPPPPPTYRIGGSVSGLDGTGLTLHSSLGENVLVTANGAFAFPTRVVSGTAYTITVSVQPVNRTQECVVAANGTGTVGAADVSNVTVACTTRSFTVGGAVAGLLGTGLELQNGAETITVDPDLDPTTAFAFGTPVPSGDGFDVSVKTQPSSPPQSCEVSGGAGIVGSGDVTSVTVNCSTLYTVGGHVTGLQGTLVLQNAGGDDLTLTLADGDFAFATPLETGATFDVTVLTSPTSPWQECAVENGQGTVGTANVTTIAVTCTTKYTVGGSVTGLLGTGLVLQNDGGDDLAIDPAGATTFVFATRLPLDAAYLVTVASSPPTEVCSVSNGAGTMPAGNVEDVAVACQCRPLLGNCDGEADDGCETPLDTLADCGACGNPCAVANGTPTCSSGTCEVLSCSAPFGDCNGSSADGCESDSTSDPNNCGGCGTICPVPAHGIRGCSAGTCGIAACAATWGDCNGVTADGCEESLKADPHCGGCGNDCGALGMTCVKLSGNDYGCE